MTSVADALDRTEPTEPPDNREKARRIMQATAAAFGVTAEDILGSTRTRPVIDARHVAMAVVRAATPLSWPVIGELFDRDHTTVMHAVQKVLADEEKRAWAAAVFGEKGWRNIGPNTCPGDMLVASPEMGEPGTADTARALATPEQAGATMPHDTHPRAGDA